MKIEIGGRVTAECDTKIKLEEKKLMFVHRNHRAIEVDPTQRKKCHSKYARGGKNTEYLLFSVLISN